MGKGAVEKVELNFVRSKFPGGGGVSRLHFQKRPCGSRWEFRASANTCADALWEIFVARRPVWRPVRWNGTEYPRIWWGLDSENSRPLLGHCRPDWLNQNYACGVQWCGSEGGKE